MKRLTLFSLLLVLPGCNRHVFTPDVKAPVVSGNRAYLPLNLPGRGYENAPAVFFCIEQFERNRNVRITAKTFEERFASSPNGQDFIYGMWVDFVPAQAAEILSAK